MTKPYRHRRTSNPDNPFPDPLEPGEIAVNTANRQLALGDADSLQVGKPLNLLPIRYFDVRASYAAGDLMVEAGSIYRALAAVPPGPFDEADWEEAGGGGGSSVFVSDTPPPDVPDNSLWWESDSGMLYVRYNDGNTVQWVLAMPVSTPPDVSGFVKKTGDTMTGNLIVNAADAQLVLKATDATTQPQVRFHQGTLQRWTAYNTAGPSADFNIARYDDTGNYIDDPIGITRVDGRVYLKQDPIAPFGAATKQYADARVVNAMAATGIQINGGMEVDQPNGGNTVIIAATSWDGHLIDGFRVANTTGATYNATQFATTIPGYVKSLKINCTNGVAATGVQTFDLMQLVEGFRISRLAWGTPMATPLTVGFWIKSSITGTFKVYISNDNYSTVQETVLTVTTANTPQWMTYTFPAQTTGTWKKDNTFAMRVIIRLAGGGTLDLGSLTGANVEITGLVLLPGIVAITAAQSPLLMRPYGEELRTCQRYYQIYKNMIIGSAAYIATASTYLDVPLPVVTRADPTVTFSNVVNFNSSGVSVQTSSMAHLSVTAAGTASGNFNSVFDVALDARL